MIKRNEVKKLNAESLLKLVYAEEAKFPRMNKSDYDFLRKTYNKKVKEEKENKK